MFFRSSKKSDTSSAEIETAQTFYATIDRTQATIRFTVDGVILSANDNFLNALGYSLSEIEGQHHSLFVDKDHVASDEYKQFWERLKAGEAFTDQFPRLTKSGDIIWIQATYAPVFDENQDTVGVIKIATDITQRQHDLADIAKGLDALSEGNLSYPIKVSKLSDLRPIGLSFQKAMRQLSSSISMVQEISHAVERTASEVGQASTELSQRTETQAATLEETAAAIEELTATVRTSAEGASEVESSVEDAKVTAEKGGAVVTEAVRAMSLIEESSSKISQIISVIDDIAFQTNLLALNAGVEAARAGEAGRGFAVVASEVRALAQRASDAAGEIKGLITDSSGHVANGVSLVGRAGDELEKIISVVADISNNIISIARGTTEQSVTLNEINMGMSQLDAVTQHNAAMVEETTAASQTLASDASQLSEQVRSFIVGEVGGSAHYDADQHESHSASDDDAFAA